MKRYLFAVVLLCIISKVQAQVFVGIEGGLGEGGIKSSASNLIVPYWGVQAGIVYKRIMAGIGIRNWRTDFAGNIKPKDPGIYPLIMLYDNSFIKSTSIPVYIGVALPIDSKVAIQGKGIYAPTFVREGKIQPVGIPGFIAQMEKQFYSSVGFDIVAEFRFAKQIGLGIKFTHLRYVDNLKYTVGDNRAEAYYSNTTIKPHVSSVGLQFNYYF